MDEKKEKAIRSRIYPKIWDATFLLTYNNMKVFEYLIDQLDKNKRCKILDIGCGYKPYQRLFDEKGFNFEYIGVDFDRKSYADYMLDMNKDKLPFDNSSFDLIILSEVLEHLYNPFNAIHEAVRVVKKNSFIYISTPFIFSYHGTPYDFYRFTEFFYRKLAEELSLEIIKVEKSGSFFTIPLFTTNILTDIILSRLKLNVFSYSIFSFVNILGMVIDYIALKLANKCSLKEKLQFMNCGIALILKKCVE